MMNIKVLKTYEISDELWRQIVHGFYESFETRTTIQGMKEGFCIKNPDGYGYHAIALTDEGELMGYNVFSPVYYKNGLKTVVSGSTYVRPKFRIHEFLFLDMVNALRKAAIEDGFDVEIGVPNHNSERFALKILKFKPVAELNYYILPFNLSRVINKPRLHHIDWFVKFFSVFHIFLHSALSSILNIKEKKVKYEVDLENNYWEHRFGRGYYKEFNDDTFSAYWLPYEENGAKAVYLMDFREGKERTYRSLVKAIRAIVKEEKVDMILFVGFLHMKQFALFKCPKRFVPKRLPLTYYVLNKKDKDKYADMQDVNNWNFSLMNFDAR